MHCFEQGGEKTWLILWIPISNRRASLGSPVPIAVVAATCSQENIAEISSSVQWKVFVMYLYPD